MSTHRSLLNMKLRYSLHYVNLVTDGLFVVVWKFDTRIIYYDIFFVTCKKTVFSFNIILY